MEVLLGLDGSTPAERALERTVERAREAGDSITVVVYAGPEGADLAALEERARDRLAAAGFEPDVRRLETDPGAGILELAEAGYDSIVLGGGRVSPMGKIRLDEVLEFVIANARTTVTLVR